MLSEQTTRASACVRVLRTNTVAVPEAFKALDALQVPAVTQTTHSHAKSQQSTATMTHVNVRSACVKRYSDVSTMQDQNDYGAPC